jgi:hypothetical protein
VTFRDGKGKLMASRSGIARIVRRYDENGRLVEAAYFSIDGRPVQHRNGMSRGNRMGTE